MLTDGAVDVDAGVGQHEACGERGPAAALAGHDDAVGGPFQHFAAVALREGGGVGDLRVGVDVDEPIGGDVTAPAAHGRRDGRDERVEAVGCGGGSVEVADGCAHVAHANTTVPGGGRTSQRTGGTETAIITSTISSPSLR
ncbi:hypothetical protein GCM10010381_23780 [Streptomyces xantholiticus]|nr:hypothetical protein GCM10010381_23780 [Streptomyces xantholiticus]